MKMIVAYLPVEQRERIVDALAAGHVHGLSISDSKGFGQEHDASHPDYKSYFGVEWTPKARLEVVCQDDEVDHILNVFYEAAHRGQKGDGKIFILPVEDALRIKTGERGKSAIGKRFSGPSAHPGSERKPD